MPKVSILMNCYNGEQYLHQAINSVFQQSIDCWELVFVDNNSSDKSAKIAKSFGDKVRVITTPHFMTLGEARSFGLTYCTGDYIAFLDVDDSWEANKLELQLEALDSSNAGFCYSSWRAISNNTMLNDKLYVVKQAPVSLSLLLKRYEVNFQTLVVRRSLGIEFDTQYRYAPDYKLVLSCAAKSDGIALEACLAKYRIHDESLTSKTMEIWGDEVHSILDELEDIFPERVQSFARELRIARARGDYLRARYLIENLARYRDGQRLMLKHAFVTTRCAILCCLSFVPALWIEFHKSKV